MNQLTISCDECCLQGTSACEDCVVSFLLGNDDLEASSIAGEVDRDGHAQAVIVDAAEIRAMRLLHSHGLVPTLRFARRVG